MGIRRWNRRDPALRRRNTEEYRSTTHDGEDVRSSTDGNEQLLDHLQQEVAELRNLLERKERELEKEKQERRELRRVVRRQEDTIGALQQRLRSAGLASDDDDDDEALAPTVDDDVNKFGDKRRSMEEDEKRRDVEQANVDEKKKERRTKESEEETMTLLLEAMDQEAILPADGYHEEDGADEQQLPKSEAKKNEDEDENEVKNENKEKNEENEDEEALLCDMSPTLRFDGEHDVDYYAGEEAPSGIVSDAKTPGPDADRSLTPPGELALVGKRKRVDENTAAPAKVSLSALLRKHLSPLRASPHPRTADDPTDRSPSEPRARPPPPLALALGSDVGDDAEKLPRPSPGRVEVPRTPSPARDVADGNGGERTRQAVSPMFKALFLAKKKTAD
ncbi:uncharacterized protein ACA1_356000 [Acanthamoeba castellanii str. Neff]|uniref:Uncharacterized protein n=1 Tax=Acanthamoeba castellanii (strain ATCC 30010 / Neff) TaxID=1257118 RepID=L8H6U4_ACACF|nr:uncharacterized protein ACA1_356000 [Acanthamoeba castellanii str. Neff]ELR21234.1 hypothetical protein ACA1_356000 [Acanthamoeba castellanii str. Neff]